MWIRTAAPNSRAGPGGRQGPGAKLLALAAALALAGGCFRARGTPDEPVIRGLELDGVKAVDEADLRAKLATQASGRTAWGDVWRLDPDALAVDRQRVVQFYKERGYYHAAVEDVEVLPDGDGRVRVVFHIREGEPVRVSSIQVEWLDAVPEAKARAGTLPLARGKVFTWAAFDAGRAQLLAALAATGYATSTVTHAAQVHGAENTADVTYRVVAGRRFRFGAISVAGNAAVPAEKVVAQAERFAPPGEWYDERVLDRIQLRVFQLGAFSGVRVSRGTPDPEHGTVPIVVAVREAPLRTLRLGPGLGFDATRFDVQGQAAWIHRNWLGDLRRLELQAKVGYAWIPSPITATREGTVGKLGVSLSQPGVLGPAVDVATKVEVEKILEQAYSAYSETLSLGTPFRLGQRWTIVPSYNLEVYQLSNVTGDVTESLPQVRNCPGEVCLLQYLEQRVSWDGRDNPLITTEGFYASLTVQEGFLLGGQGYRYLRLVPEVRHFAPLSRDIVLATRIRLGALVPLGETGPAPVMALATAGGAGSMRGYGSERLSPMVEQGGEWVPTGGNGVLEASVEVRRNLQGNLVGVLFLDAGNVSEASGSPSEYQSVLDLSMLQLAVGVGVRYRTSVGPFRADLGCRLPTDWSPDVPFRERFPPVPGNSGHREPILVLHIALGEAF